MASSFYTLFLNNPIINHFLTPHRHRHTSFLHADSVVRHEKKKDDPPLQKQSHKAVSKMDTKADVTRVDKKKREADEDEDDDEEDDDRKFIQVQLFKEEDINWECKCISKQMNGPCSAQFRKAFFCFLNSKYWFIYLLTTNYLLFFLVLCNMTQYGGGAGHGLREGLYRVAHLYHRAS